MDYHLQLLCDEWKNVESMLNSLVNLDLSKQFSRILTLSYNNLPCHLKSCFLYLGVFPEDFEIEIKKVIRLWIAEGFIKEVSDQKTTLEELGEVYLHDLINRSLIVISGRSSDGKIKTCRMHDLLHDLCVSKVKNEKLLHNKQRIEHYRISLSDDNRWASVELRPPLFYDLSIDLCKCRSLLCFEMYTYHGGHDWLKVNSFKMIRVLDFSVFAYSDSGMPPDMDIVLLRYLALPSNRLLTSIPVRKNKNLQTLVVCQGIYGNQELPHGIWDLPQLRHFEFNHQLSIYNPEVVQLNLQTMYWLHSFQCTKQVFFMIPNVKELGIIISQGSRNHCCLENLNCLKQLEKLKVQGTYCGIELPKHAYSFPQNLKSIMFSKTLMPWEAMSIISMLPNLEVLKLKNHACVGQEWELTEEDGFRRLKLLLISITDLKHWKAGDDVENPFPVLEQIFLRNSFKLKEMPSWIEDLSNLKSIQLEHCYASLVSSARMIEQEQRECYGEEYGFQILDFHTQSDEKSSEREDNEDEKNSDAQSLWINARSLCIAWVDDPIYWIWIRDSEQEVAKLLMVFWLYIIGTVDTGILSKMTCYSAYLVFKLTSNTYGLDTALTSVRYIKDKKSNNDNDQRCQVFLAKTRSSGDSGQFPDCRHDGWMEIKLGNFYVSSGNEGKVEMGLWNTLDTIGKCGLIVKGIEVRPN